MKFQLLRTLASVLLIVSISGNMAFAQAENAPNQQVSYVVAGKGIQDRKTGDVVVLACENIECKTVRFLLFKQGALPEFVGASIKMPSAPSDQLHAKAMKALLDEFFITHQTDQSIKNRFAFFSITSLMVGGGVMMGGLATGLIAFASGTGWLVGVTFFCAFMMNRYHLGNRVFHGMSLENQVTYQEGWNWSTMTEKTSHVSFENILDQIQNGYYDHEHMEGHLKRAQEKKARLAKKGVIF